jgi:hypothetical protein
MRSPRLGEPLLVLLLAVVATTVLMHPLVLKMDRVGRVNTGDGQFSIWNVAWVAHSLTTAPGDVYDANIFYPHRRTLAYSEANLGAGLLAVPVWLATKNPYFAHNSAVVVAMLLSVTGAYALVRRLTGDRWAATFAALAFAFCPFIYARTAHIQLLMTGGLPWSLWAFHRLLDRHSVGRALTLGLLLAAQGLSCAYYGIFAGLSVGVGVLFYAVARGHYRRAQYWGGITLAAAVAVGIVLPFLLPYLQLDDANFRRTLWESGLYAANLAAYRTSPTWAHRWFLPAEETWTEVAFPGIVTVVLASFGCLWAMRDQFAPAQAAALTSRGSHTISPRETVAFYGLLAGLSIWASFGPQAGLYTVLYRTIPVFELLRVPARLAIVVTLCLVVCAAVALAHLVRRGRRARPWVPIGVLLLTGAELVAIPLPIPVVDPRPHPVYAALARLPSAPVAVFPFFHTRPDFPRHSYYMLQSTTHWRPLINGYSDHIPDDFRRMVFGLSTFPSRGAFELLRRRRVRFVVVHAHLYDDRNRRKLLDGLQTYGAYLRAILKHDDVWLYEITRWPEADGGRLSPPDTLGPS